MKKYLLLFSIIASSNIALASFVDVDERHSNFDAINYVEGKKIVMGYEGNYYKPENKINRAEFIKIIIKTVFSEDQIKGANCFNDVKNEWFAKYVCTAKENNIISGYIDGSFKPEQNITFVESAKIISEVLKLNIANNEGYIWHKSYVDSLSDINAIPSTIWDFEQEVSRGEMAEMIYRINNNIKNKRSHNYNFLLGLEIDDRLLNLSDIGTVVVGDYFYDKHDVYYKNNRKLSCIDIKTFELIDGDYAMDKDNIIYKDIILPADRKTFQVLAMEQKGKTIFYAKDKNNLYFKSILIKDFDFNKIDEIKECFEYIPDISCFQNQVSKDNIALLEIDYSKDKNNVYFGDNILRNRDPETFEILDDNLVKDKNHIYFTKERNNSYSLIQDNDIIDGVHAETFEIIDNNYAKDQYKVHYYFKGRKPHLESIRTADPNSFQVINEKYSKDNDSVFYLNNRMVNIDLDSFKVLEGDYAKDKYRCFYKEKAIDKCPDEALLNNDVNKNVYTKYKDNVSCYGSIMKQFDSETFVILADSPPFAKDKNNYYIRCGVYKKKSAKKESCMTTAEYVSYLDIIADKNTTEYDNIDYLEEESLLEKGEADNFREIGGQFYVYKYNNTELTSIVTNRYFADQDNIYLFKIDTKNDNSSKLSFEVIEKSDSKTFEIIMRSSVRQKYYALDKNYVYYYGKIIEEADPYTFEVIKSVDEYALDKNNVYFNGGIIKDCDPATFELFSFDGDVSGGSFIRDKNSIYYLTKKIESADPNTFVHIKKDAFTSSNYYKDRNNIFFINRFAGVENVISHLLEDDYDQIFSIETLSDVDIDSFEVLAFFYSKDNNNVYYAGKKIDNADSNSFTYLSNFYFKDKNHIYCKGEILEGLDPDNFQTEDNCQ